MSELVATLCSGKGELVVGGPKPSLQKFREAIQRRYVLLKFTETRGGTDLGMDLDWEKCRVDEASLQDGVGSVYLEGTLTLDYVPVRFAAEVDLELLAGTGQLFTVA